MAKNLRVHSEKSLGSPGLVQQLCQVLACVYIYIYIYINIRHLHWISSLQSEEREANTNPHISLAYKLIDAVNIVRISLRKSWRTKSAVLYRAIDS